MKKFVKYFLSVLIIVLISAFVLDYSFTAFYKSSRPRNKISLAYIGKPEKYDVVFLGSSRANNHFVPQLFVDKGYKSFNFGMSGSRLEETALLLQLLLENGNTIKNIVLEVDLNINSNGFSEGTRAAFYPFLKDSKTISNYYRTIPDFEKLRYLPFYRYLQYESRIGFRELFFTTIEKPTKNLQFYGFNGLTNTGKDMSYDLSSHFPKRNKGYELIKKIAKKNNINLISVTTPICENVKNINYFAEVTELYPEIYNLENVVTNDAYFSSCGHMNEKGAKRFTEYVLNKFFKN